MPSENERGNQQEAAGGGNVREGGAVGGEGAGVEHVPQLEQHEDGEKQALFVAREQPAAVMRGREEGGEGGDIEISEIFCQSHQDCRKQQPRAEQAFPHGAGDDEVVAAARLLVHYLSRGRQGGKRHGGEGVHNDVHPEHLRHRERRLLACERAEQHHEAGTHVDGHLEQDKPLDIFVERATPHHGVGYAGEGTVHNGDVGRFLGHARAVAHREAHVGGFEGGRIVGAVARDGHHLTFLLQGFYQSLFVHGTGAGDDFKVEDALFEFCIGEGGELGPRDFAPRIVAGLPQTDLPPDFAGGARRVAGYNLDADTRVDAGFYGIGHVGADGVGNGGETEEREVACRAAAVSKGFARIVQNLIGEAERAHGFLLIAEEHGGELLLRDARRSAAAETEHDFGRTL